MNERAAQHAASHRRLHGALQLLGIWLAVGLTANWVVRGGGFVDASLLTLETVAFLAPVQHGAARLVQLVLSFGAVVVMWYTAWTSLDLRMDGYFRWRREEKRRMRTLSAIGDHFIVCGGGRVGGHLGELLAAKGEPFVLVERSPAGAEEARRRGWLVVEGDALDEAALTEAAIARARAVMCVLPETEKNILVALTARELNAAIEIHARCDQPSYEAKLRRAGANHVFFPERACAEQMLAAADEREKAAASG